MKQLLFITILVTVVFNFSVQAQTDTLVNHVVNDVIQRQLIEDNIRIAHMEKEMSNFKALVERESDQRHKRLDNWANGLIILIIIFGIILPMFGFAVAFLVFREIKNRKQKLYKLLDTIEYKKANFDADVKKQLQLIEEESLKYLESFEKQIEQQTEILNSQYSSYLTNLEKYKEESQIYEKELQQLSGMTEDSQIDLNKLEQIIDDERTSKFERDWAIALSDYLSACKTGNLDKYREAVVKSKRLINNYSSKINYYNLSYIYANIAACYGNLLNYDAFEQYNNAAIVLNAGYYKNWYNKALVLYYKKNYAEAIKYYGEAIGLNPNDSAIWKNKGNALFELKEYEEAIQCYDESIHLNPYYFDVWCNKGVALCGLKRYEEALLCYNESIRLNPDHFDSWFNKGVILFRLRRYEEALNSNDKAIHIKLDNGRAWNNKGVILENMGGKHYPDSLECYKIASELDPNNEIYKNNIDRIQQKLELQLVD